MLIFYPGEYVLSSALFLLTLLVLKHDLKRFEKNKVTNVTNILYEEENINRQLAAAAAAGTEDVIVNVSNNDGNNK